MPEIYHSFPIQAPSQKVYDCMVLPEGLDMWWCLNTRGTPGLGETYHLHFGEGYNWEAVVSQCEPGVALEWTMTVADADWLHSRVGFRLREESGLTMVDFYHIGWPETNAHFKGSNYCWAMYLRILKRYLEYGEIVPYALRLEV